MAFIRYVPEDEASPQLRALYRRYREPHGDIDHILKIHSLNPASLEGHARFYKTLMYGHSELTRVQREMIAVVVSALNRCFY